MPELRCPDCGGNTLILYGKTKAGKQKYKCKNPDCVRQFVAESTHLIDPRDMDTILRMLAAKFAPTIIKTAVPDVSLSRIYQLRRKAQND